jgi:DNA-directed RNA polymerase subunit H
MELNIIIENLKKMLIYQGDDITEFEEHECILERSAFGNKEAIVEFHTKNSTILFGLTNHTRKLIIDLLKNATKSFDEYFVNSFNSRKRIICIFSEDQTITTAHRQAIQQFDKVIQKHGGMIQDFTTKQLKFDPIQHHLVPKHRKLSNEEAAEVMAKYNIASKTQLPHILKTDIISKWLGAVPGQIFEIERLNPNSGVSYYYRVVV